MSDINSIPTTITPDAAASAPAEVAPTGCLLRMVWTIAGNAAIYLTLATIASTRPPLPSGLDGVVVAVWMVMLAARWFDITRFGGRTIRDEPATSAHWRRYALMLTAITAAAWSLAHLIAGSFG